MFKSMENQDLADELYNSIVKNAENFKFIKNSLITNFYNDYLEFFKKMRKQKELSVGDFDSKITYTKDNNLEYIIIKDLSTTKEYEINLYALVIEFRDIFLYQMNSAYLDVFLKQIKRGELRKNTIAIITNNINSRGKVEVVVDVFNYYIKNT